MFSQLAISFIDMILRPATLTSMALMIIGLALCFLAGRITRAVRKTSNVSSDDKLLLTLKVIGLVILLLGLIVMIFNCL